MGAPSKRARKIRRASEFDVGRLTGILERPKDSGHPVFAWTLEDIYAARNDQMRGNFKRPAQLAESMRSDDALFIAKTNRVAPQRSIKREIKAVGGARGVPIATEAEALFGQTGVGVHPDTLADIESCLVDHNVAFAVINAVPREDGSRVDFFLSYWPIRYVRWDALARCYMARVEPGTSPAGDAIRLPGQTFMSGTEVPIIHGDGRWVVFQKTEIESFKHATLLPASMVWARHAFSIRDWAKGSVAHGNAKVIGEMPQGVALQDANGALTKEAEQFANLLRAIATSDAPVGIRPFGSKTDFLTSQSSAWQIFKELVDNAEKAAARIYLGTDGTLGAQGGAPGVDITALFGVASTIVQGDLECIERGINTGLIEPWCATNFGDSSKAPKMRYLIPDNDADAARGSVAVRSKDFYAELASAKETGVAITQAFVDATAKKYGIASPKLATVTPAGAGA